MRVANGQFDALRNRWWVIAALLTLCACTAVDAAEVDIELSTRRPIAGVTFQLEVTITNAESYSQPDIPEVHWAEQIGGPSRQSYERLTTINGRMTKSRTVVMRYEFLALAPGEYTFPAVAVTADGSTFRSPQKPVLVTKAESGDVLSAEIVAERDQIYLGEPLELTLRIWIKRYIEAPLKVVLSDQQTWQFVQLDRCSWGAFAEALEQALGRRGRALDGREVTRSTTDGQERVYYLYEVKTRQWPQQTGTVEIDPVRLLVEYPTGLERREDMFGREQLYVSGYQSTVERADPPTIEVLPPPASGQPDVFSGAVGRFSMVVDAQPTDVAVGDPITLTIIITDDTNDRVRLETLQPPPLRQVEPLIDDFRVPSEPLTGVVQGRSKVFRQTIRARRAGIDSLPSIPFAYFDPQQERYVTVRSQPIPINVEPSATVDASDVEGAAPAGNGESTELTELEGGILANKTGAATLLADQRLTLQWWHFVVLALPAVLFTAVAVSTARQRRLQSNAGLIRARKAGRRAMQRIGQAKRLSGVAQAETVASALSGYVEDRLQAPAGAMTRADVVERLRGSAMDETVVDDVEHVLQACEAMKYGASGASANGIADRAGRCIERLERSKLG